MNEAKRYPSLPAREAMGFASLYPSYDKHNFAISRHDLPEVCIFFCPPDLEGRREDRVLAAPAVPRAICANKTAHEHTGQREHSGLPSLRKGEYGGKNRRYINAVRLVCPPLCPDQRSHKRAWSPYSYGARSSY